MYRLKAFAAMAILASILSGCSNSSSSPEPCTYCNTVITGVDSGFTASSISLSDAYTPYDLVENYAAQNLSDIASATQGNYFYRLGKSSQHNITKYSFDNPNISEWQFSVGADSNPQDIVFVSETKAYVIRYGSGSIWVVNPSVTASEESDFKIGEIDLSHYDADGVPNMKGAVIVDGKLFVIMQALDAGWVPGQAILAVIDINTDQEIDTDGNAGNGVQGISLNVKNPVDIDAFGGNIYVTGVGRYFPVEYTGGIERVNASTYAQELLVDDGGDLGQIDNAIIVSSSTGYFVDYAGWQNTSLKRFNPTTGVVETDAVTTFDGIDIRSLALSPEGLVWVGVGDSTEPEIRLLDPATDLVAETIPTTLNPIQIIFSD